MNNKILVILIILFCVGNVSALGVTPGRTTIDFEPGLTRSVSYEVINSGGTDIGLVMTTSGELGEYITLPVSNADMAGDEKTKEFNYNLNLPQDLSPGLHTGEVFVLQVPGDADKSGATVLATLAVVTQVYVYVPYPGKFANAELTIYNANQGEKVVFVFPVVSAGEFDLTSVRANVDIYNKLDEKVGSFDTDSISIASGDKGEILYEWDAEVPIGEYRAEAHVIYDEGTINLEEKFSVGNQELELTSIEVSNFNLGEIVKLEMLVENKWSEAIGSAFTETVIRDDNGDVVSAFDSASYVVDALSKKVFVSYWDTAGVKEGKYETEVSINYGDKSSKKNLEFEVGKNDLNVVGLGYVISADSSDEAGLDTIVLVLIVVIVLLVLINLLWFFMLRKKLK